MTCRYAILLLFFFMLIYIASPSVLAQIPTESGGTAQSYHVGGFDPARDAAKDLREAVALAGQSARRVLVDVGGEWCVWCRRLDTLFTADQSLRAFRDSNYVTLKINWSRENKNEKVLSQWPKIPGYPHFFVLEKDGKFLHSQDTGELEKGKAHDPGKVLSFLKAWAPPARKI